MQNFTLSLEDAVLEKPLGHRRSQIDLPFGNALFPYQMRWKSVPQKLNFAIAKQYQNVIL